jgi:hypothetical protein
MIVNTINVATAGTRVQAGDSGSIQSVFFKARSANANTIYVGDSTVTSTKGIALEPGEDITISFKGRGKMQDFYADADTSADKVDYVADNS